VPDDLDSEIRFYAEALKRLPGFADDEDVIILLIRRDEIQDRFANGERVSPCVVTALETADDYLWGIRGQLLRKFPSVFYMDRGAPDNFWWWWLAKGEAARAQSGKKEVAA
jgi:hypothetical protein